MNVLDQIYKTFNVIEKNNYGNGFSLTIEQNGELFVVNVHGCEITVYRAFISNNEINLLPNSKTGKTVKTIVNFISKYA